MPRALLVQVDPLVVSQVSEILRGEGYEVLVERDGLDALVAVERLAPDVVLSDIAMPRLDGISFLQALRAREDTRRIPVLILSTVADPETMLLGLAAGARSYLTVPLEREELIFKVKRAVVS
ncbi:MAG: response regulator [Polyangia bacterium]|jgi:CheY-like chemotaxis protein|nr:response regulator [Polyangia bacterium]